MLLLSVFYNFSHDFIIFSVTRFCFWICVVLSEGMQTSFFCLQGLFIPWVIQSLLSFRTFVFNWKTNLKND